jgi:hypothetical protein
MYFNTAFLVLYWIYNPVYLSLLHGFVTVDFSGAVSLVSHPNPSWKTREYISSGLFPLICPKCVPLPRDYAPSSIALRVTGGRNPPLHDKAIVLEEQVIQYYWSIIVVLVEVTDIKNSFS